MKNSADDSLLDELLKTLNHGLHRLLAMVFGHSEDMAAHSEGFARIREIRGSLLIQLSPILGPTRISSRPTTKQMLPDSMILSTGEFFDSMLCARTIRPF
jgi:hypothetical protein